MYAQGKGDPTRAIKALFIVAIAMAALGLLGAVIAASVFVMSSATSLVSAIGRVCFWGFLPVLFLSGILGLAALVLWKKRNSGRI